MGTKTDIFKNSKPGLHEDKRLNKPVCIPRRCSLRLPVKVKCRYGLKYESTESRAAHLIVNGRTFDLSDKGIGIEGIQGMPPDSRVDIVLYPGSEPLRIEAITKWFSPQAGNRNWRMGLEVTNPHNRISQIYRSLSKKHALKIPAVESSKDKLPS